MNKTIWIEVKYADPDFDTKGIQELTMLRLRRAAYTAFYVIYRQTEEQRTYIVYPEHIGEDFDNHQVSAPGFNHDWVIEYVKGLML